MPKLIDTAIPTQFPGCPKYLSKPPKKRRTICRNENFIANKKQKLDATAETSVGGFVEESGKYIHTFLIYFDN